MKFTPILIIFYTFLQINTTTSSGNTDYTIQNKEICKESDVFIANIVRFHKATNDIHELIQDALTEYRNCIDKAEADEHTCKYYLGVISQDLKPYKNGISKQMIEHSVKYGSWYKVLNHRLYRHTNCAFPMRCKGIEYFLLKLLPQLDDMDFVINTADWPKLYSDFGVKSVVFSFSKTKEYLDIMYPAWSFWAGGPAIELHPTGIGRWDLMRESLQKASAKSAWEKKHSEGFFRGSRTSDERDALVLLSRRKPELVDAKYTKNQAWKSLKDTLNEEPSKEVSFEDHCQYKYLFNFRGVAASFRLKHLFLCKSLVFHVGNMWNEFFYPALKPWVHYVPLKRYLTEQEIEDVLVFFKNHDDLAREIAERGYKFIWDNLRMEDIECYWLNLLKKYQILLNYTVTSDPELIDITPKHIEL